MIIYWKNTGGNSKSWLTDGFRHLEKWLEKEKYVSLKPFCKLAA